MNINKILELKAHPEIWHRFLNYLDCPSEEYLAIAIKKATWLSKSHLILDIDDTLNTFKYNIDGGFNSEEVSKVGFFRSLPAKNDIWIYEILQEIGIYVGICTTCYFTPHCKTEKLEWVAEQMPFIKRSHIVLNEINCSKSKTMISKHGNIKDFILIDDYGENLKDWQAAGGIAIKMAKTYKPRQYPTMLNHLQAIDIVLGTLKCTHKKGK